MSGPDFICIGMPKAGTGWLFDQLHNHPDFWMPPVKELNYFNRRVPQMQNARKHLRRAKRSEKKGAASEPRRPQRPYEQRDLAFLEEASSLRRRPRSVQEYASLFRHKGARLSGDISPSYSQISDEIVKQIAAGLPRTKIVLLVRDPVARAWSRICMSHRAGEFDASYLDKPNELRTFLEQYQKIKDRSRPTEIVERWRRCGPDMSFRHFFFDHLVVEPEKMRQDILKFLGADPGRVSGEISASHNRKADKPKLDLNETAKSVLVEHFRSELKACSDMFGGPALDWAAKYGI